ncbi:MAG: hypothetical protein JST51_20105 [Armatimonadetes bacterium]|nr:hypothetical protein [Armatimonadota bacterium]
MDDNELPLSEDDSQPSLFESDGPSFDAKEGLRHTQELANLLSAQKRGDLDWHDRLDAEFLVSTFDHNARQPYFVGPDGIRYFGFRLPQAGVIAVTQPNDNLDQMIEWGAGAAILDAAGNAIYVYSPGDIVSFRLYGKTRVRWKGGWGEEPNGEAYRAGGIVHSGPPNEDMFPPLAARCVDFHFGRWAGKKEALHGSEFGVSVCRLASTTKPEEPSELTFNVFSEDLERLWKHGTSNFSGYLCYCLPYHIGLRVILSSQTAFGRFHFTSVREMYEKAGLKPISL